MSENSDTGNLSLSRNKKFAIFEITAIVFSVLLALFLSELWQTREESAGHRKTLELVLTELNSNHSDMKESTAYYNKMADALQPILARDEVIAEDITGIEGCCTIMGLAT